MNSTAEQRTCPNCGTAIPANAPQGVCPKCLMAAAAVSTEDGQTGGKRPEAPSLERLAAAFPQLDVIEFIGQGGMGAVYKARQKQLDRIVALKVLPPGIGGDPAFAERFTREAKALAKLLHPNIVALFEFGQADGIYYLLMEFVDGVSLGQLLRASRVSAREALAIVPQICDALQYAHDQGIVHRDIKPENILLDRRGRVKVADFGLAKLVDANAPLTPSLSPSDGARVAARPGEGKTPALTDAGKVMGTPAYMAPEQREHPAEVDHRADIYALGVVFYQMLTGELPGKRMEPPSRKVQIDVRLDEVVMRALEKKPELRYQQASEVKTCVEKIASGAAVPTASSGSRRKEAAQSVSSQPTRRPWRLIAVAALFIAGGCATAWEIAHDLPRHSYDFNLGVLALPIGIGLLRRRPWWRMAALASLWFDFAWLLVGGGMVLTGHRVPNATVKLLGHEVTGPARIWIGVLASTLVAALLIWMYRVLVRPEVKDLFQRGPFARPWIEWGTLVAALGLALTVSWLLLETGLDRINSTLTASSFGPTLERVVYVDRPESAFLDLTTANYVNPPKDINPANWRSEELSGWLADGPNADLMATVNDGQTRLALCYTSFRLVPNKAWGKPWLMDAWPAQVLADAPAGTQPVQVLSRQEGLVTCTFHTRRHAAGLLQITGFSDNPRGVKIRYKLVRAKRDDGK